MFDKNKSAQQSIETGQSELDQQLSSLTVHTIPEEFYDGGTGNVGAHSHQSKKVESDKGTKKGDENNVDVKAEKKPEQKKAEHLELSAKAPDQFQRVSDVNTKLVVSGVVLLVALVLLGGLVYWWVAIREVPEPIAEPVIIEVLEPELVLEPEIVEEETEVIEPEPEPIPIYPFGLREYSLALDSDFDQLTDVEEREIYGSDPVRPDDDSDGFVDGHEVYHLYNPAAVKPIDLSETGLIRVYRNSVFGYEVFYPTVWTLEQLDDSGQEVAYVSQRGERVLVRVHDNDQELSLRDWYRSYAGAVDDSSLRLVSTIGDLVGLMSPDSLSLYIARDSVIYELHYDLGFSQMANYMRTFVMMQNSFSFVGPITQQPARLYPIIHPTFGDQEDVVVDDEREVSDDVFDEPVQEEASDENATTTVATSDATDNNATTTESTIEPAEDGSGFATSS